MIKYKADPSALARRVGSVSMTLTNLTKHGARNAMSFRWLNSFTILAVILIAIGVIGAVSGGRMIFDPGREPSGREWMLYLVAGALMLINGLLAPATAREDSDDQDVAPPAAGNRARAAGAAAATSSSVPVTAPVTAEPDR